MNKSYQQRNKMIFQSGKIPPLEIPEGTTKDEAEKLRKAHKEKWLNIWKELDHKLKTMPYSGPKQID